MSCSPGTGSPAGNLPVIGLFHSLKFQSITSVYLASSAREHIIIKSRPQQMSVFVRNGFFLQADALRVDAGERLILPLVCMINSKIPIMSIPISVSQ
jgi:hypothetical protein